MKGPAIFLAQFAGDTAPFNTFESICRWAAALGYKGVQIPTWDGRLFDLTKAAASQAYCDEIKGTAAQHGLAITELSTHLQGQLVAVHPAYDEAFDAFAPAAVQGNPTARQAWAVEQLSHAARASARLGLSASVTFSGALAWPYLSVAAAPARLIETAFDELARRGSLARRLRRGRCRPHYEIHPGGPFTAPPEMFSSVSAMPRCNIAIRREQLDIWRSSIWPTQGLPREDANSTFPGRQGVYSGLAPADRAGRSARPATAVTSAAFLETRGAGYDSWAVLEWSAASRVPRTARARVQIHRRPHHFASPTRLRCRRGGGGSSGSTACWDRKESLRD